MTRRTRAARVPSWDLPGMANLLRGLSLPDDAAELLLFIDLCRRSLRLRAWLFGRFAAEPSTQAGFRAFLNDPAGPEPDRPLWPRVLADAVRPCPQRPAPGTGPYGGLTELELLALIKGYQAGLQDVSTFALVRFWRRFAAAKVDDVPLALQLATATHFGRLANDDSGRLARELQEVLRFFRHRSNQALGAADFGHADSWKIQLLLHLLDHPRPAYKVSALRSALSPTHVGVASREIRRFCQRHGIRRDERPGRPPEAASQRPDAAVAAVRTGGS